MNIPTSYSPALTTQAQLENGSDSRIADSISVSESCRISTDNNHTESGQIEGVDGILPAPVPPEIGTTALAWPHRQVA